MTYELEREGSKLTVRVRGKLDARSSPDLERALSDAFDDVTRVLFDLEGLEYISSAGLRILFAVYKLMAKRGGEMKVVNAGDEVRGILEMSGFASIYDFGD